MFIVRKILYANIVRNFIFKINNILDYEKAQNDKILKDLVDGDQLEKLFLEFDSHKTKEANFAYQCDKLECDLQCKLYDEE